MFQNATQQIYIRVKEERENLIIICVCIVIIHSLSFSNHFVQYLFKNRRRRRSKSATDLCGKSARNCIGKYLILIRAIETKKKKEKIKP